MTNSTWIEGGNNFSKNVLYRNLLAEIWRSLQKSQKQQEISLQQKKTLINIARITTQAKVSTYNEKGKEGPKKEVGKFRKNEKN